jgi:hypothetical protein
LGAISHQGKRVHDGAGTSREVGVNLKEGYNGDLTSRQAGSIGGQMVKKMTTIRKMSFQRKSRISDGHLVEIRYIAGIGL